MYKNKKAAKINLAAFLFLLGIILTQTLLLQF